MEPIVILVLFFGVLFVLIVGCVMSERRHTRIAFGISTLGWSGLMFLAAHTAESYNLNVWYSGAAAKLLDESVNAIEAGRQNEVATALKRMHDNLEVTYENRGNFRELAIETSSALAQKPRPAGQASPSDGNKPPN